MKCHDDVGSLKHVSFMFCSKKSIAPSIADVMQLSLKSSSVRQNCVLNFLLDFMFVFSISDRSGFRFISVQSYFLKSSSGCLDNNRKHWQ